MSSGLDDGVLLGLWAMPPMIAHRLKAATMPGPHQDRSYSVTRAMPGARFLMLGGFPNGTVLVKWRCHDDSIGVQMSSSSRPRVTAVVRSDTPSLRYTRVTCVLTVLRDTNSSSAIALRGIVVGNSART